MAPSYERYAAEIAAQTDLLRATIDGADLGAAVPTCPGWDAARLVRHVGGGQRWAASIVRSRTAEPPSPIGFDAFAPRDESDPAVLGPWLAEGAAALAAALTEAGPEARLWAPAPDGTARFYARRFTHETAVHRADAALALGVPYTLASEIALDGLDEWLELRSAVAPQPAEPGRTVHLHATDTPPGLAAEWVIDLSGGAVAWRRAHEKCAVAVRGPLTDLLLVAYRRLPVRTPGVEVFGDADLLGALLERMPVGV